GGYLEYDADLFDGATARRLLAGYQLLLAAVAGAPETAVGELQLHSEAESHQLLREHNDAARALPGDRRDGCDGCVHQLVLARAGRPPEGVAVAVPAAAGAAALSYGELAARSAALARRLVRAGVGPEVRVAVCAGRSPALPIALLAVLRAGGAYVPLDPA